MTEEEQRAAAYRWAVNTLELVTEEDIRAHLGVERGQADLDVQNVRYYVQTTTVTMAEPPAVDSRADHAENGN